MQATVKSVSSGDCLVLKGKSKNSQRVIILDFIAAPKFGNTKRDLADQVLCI